MTVKLLQVYNQYRSLFNGEEAVVQRTAELVEKHGGQARLLMRSSREIESSWSSKARAFWSGIYSRKAYTEMHRILTADRPDVVHVHNLYPLLSPSILVACRRARVPVVMTVHNQHLTCPRTDHLYRGRICERCLGGQEYHCVLRNCRENIFESVAYAVRSAVARKMRFFHDNVTLLIALSEFAKQRLTSAGFDRDRIVVLPNMVPQTAIPVDPAAGTYAAFAGRLSPEKGVDTLLEAAVLLPECPVRLAGAGPLMAALRSDVPGNARLLGQLEEKQMVGFYRQARFFVLPSKTYEMCPLVILEAMSHGLPVIASRIGAPRELVADGVSGLLFEPGDAADLAHKMKQLWESPQLCRQMGRVGYEAATRNYGEDTYYRELMGIYEKAQNLVCSNPRNEDQQPAHTGDLYLPPALRFIESTSEREASPQVNAHDTG